MALRELLRKAELHADVDFLREAAQSGAMGADFGWPSCRVLSRMHEAGTTIDANPEKWARTSGGRAWSYTEQTAEAGTTISARPEKSARTLEVRAWSNQHD